MKCLIVIILIFFKINANCQKQANHWVFGTRVGFDFSSGSPEVFRSEVNTEGSTSVISDKETGELLFYTDGTTVWNREHEIMANGEELKGTQRIIQSVIIVPIPGSVDKYYIFHMCHNCDEEPVFSSLYYSIVDMGLNNGLGAVLGAKKNVFLKNNLAQKLTAVPNKNKNGYWLITHAINSDKFFVFPISQSGIKEPITNAIGQVYNYEPNSVELGTIKASPNGKMLAVTTTQTVEPFDVGKPFELFDFDSNTGTISNVINLGSYIYQYGTSFSPDNSKLYLRGYNPFDGLHQFDLEAIDVRESRIGLIIKNPVFEASPIVPAVLEIAPNGKIYMSGGDIDPEDETDSFTKMVVINNPNAKGINADLSIIRLPFKEDQRISVGLPNFIQSIFNGLTPADNPNAPCNGETGINLYPNPSNDFISIEIAVRCFSPYRLSIYNMLGQLKASYYIEKQDSGMLSVQNFSSGLYFAVMEFADQRIVKRFVKRKSTTSLHRGSN